MVPNKILSPVDVRSAVYLVTGHCPLAAEKEVKIPIDGVDTERGGNEREIVKGNRTAATHEADAGDDKRLVIVENVVDVVVAVVDVDNRDAVLAGELEGWITTVGGLSPVDPEGVAYIGPTAAALGLAVVGRRQAGRESRPYQTGNEQARGEDQS